MKKILLGLLIIAVAAFVTASPTKSKARAYYSGDAINYEDQIIVGSTNTDSLELFKLENKQLTKFVDLKPLNTRFGTYDNFNDFKFRIEDQRLFVYAVSGWTIYKYDVSDLTSATLIKKESNTYWEWYNRLDVFGDNLATISEKGVKVWSQDLQVIDSYNLTNEIPFNINAQGTDQYIFNVKNKNKEIEVFDRTTRQVSKVLPATYFNEWGNHRVYYDSYDDMIYVGDDRSIKKYDTAGALKGVFEHSGNPGYEVTSTGNEYLYFSNGIGVVKLDKQTLEVVNAQYTTTMAVDYGWATGLKLVNSSEGEKVVIFNNSNILVLDSELNKVAFVSAKEDTRPEVKENLFLRLNTLKAPSDASVLLNGGGYYPYEKLEINFRNVKFTAVADESGRFKQVLTVPTASKEVVMAATVNQSQAGTSTPLVVEEPVDIKVVGEQSKFSYSIGFKIYNVQ